MEFIELAKKRYSVRSFKNEPVEKEKIDLILEAGRVAPTACNNQPQRIIVVETKDGLERLKRCTECHFNAPLAFIVCYDKEKCWTRPYDGKSSGEIDAGIVGTHMMLEAADIGIGSTWVMYYIPEAVRIEFELPDHIESAAILVMGYPSENCSPAKLHNTKKDMEELVSFS